MREIKYRVWDKKNKKMIYPITKDTTLEVIFDEGVLYISQDLNNPTYENYKKYIHEEYELMEYTGLKDKNGKEIYEGDVIATPAKVYNASTKKFSISPHPLICVVEWENGGFNITDSNLVEVIGNIWEHDHLLNK